MARQFHRQAGDARKFKVLSHYRAYHGVTGQALAASGWRAHKSPYEPLAPGFVHLHTPDPYRPPFEVDAGRGRRHLRPPRRAGDRAGRPGDDRGPGHRADPDVGRRRDPAGRLPAGAPSALRPARHRPRLRRDHHRVRPDREALRRRALRDLAGHPRLRQGPHRRLRRALRDGGHRPHRPGVLGPARARSSRPATPTRAIPSRARPDSRRWRRSGTATWSRTRAARGEQALERLRPLAARLAGIGDVRGQGLLVGHRVRVRPRDQGAVPGRRERRRQGAGGRQAARACSCARAIGWPCSLRR